MFFINLDIFPVFEYFTIYFYFYIYFGDCLAKLNYFIKPNPKYTSATTYNSNSINFYYFKLFCYNIE